MNRSLFTLRYERTLDAAFRTPRYAEAIELAHVSLWRRIVRAFRGVR